MLMNVWNAASSGNWAITIDPSHRRRRASLSVCTYMCQVKTNKEQIAAAAILNCIYRAGSVPPIRYFEDYIRRSRALMLFTVAHIYVCMY